MLCAQGAVDFWMELGKLYDIAILVRKQPVDWDLLVEQAKSLDMLLSLLLGLKLTQFFFQISLPENIQELCGRFPLVDIVLRAAQADLQEGLSRSP